MNGDASQVSTHNVTNNLNSRHEIRLMDYLDRACSDSCGLQRYTSIKAHRKQKAARKFYTSLPSPH